MHTAIQHRLEYCDEHILARSKLLPPYRIAMLANWPCSDRLNKVIRLCPALLPQRTESIATPLELLFLY